MLNSYPEQSTCHEYRDSCIAGNGNDSVDHGFDLQNLRTASTGMLLLHAMQVCTILGGGPETINLTLKRSLFVIMCRFVDKMYTKHCAAKKEYSATTLC